jgi:hypothetical protein
MDTLAEVEPCEPAPLIFGENGAFGITDGTSQWLVIVTREAMEASAALPDASLARLTRYLERYRTMAEAVIARKEDQDGKVWIFEKDVLAYRLGYTHPIGSKNGTRPLPVRGH